MTGAAALAKLRASQPNQRPEFAYKAAVAHADYKVAKEECDSLSGDAKDACVRDAKLKYHQ